jgi:hypothetical protein
MRSAAASPVIVSVSAETVETTAASAVAGSTAAATATATGSRIQRIRASCGPRRDADMGDLP